MNPCTCHFVFLTGPRAGEAVEFSSGRITIGRAGSADLRFDPEADLTVASLHAEILFDSGEFRLYDLGSRTGTFVNGQPASEGLILRSEDFLQFGAGGPEVVFRIGPRPEEILLPPPAQLVAELEFSSGSEAGKIYRITSESPTRIGRRADMEISLHPTEFLQVSGHHCTIVFEEGSFVVIDTSRNGTFVNGRIVQGKAYLEDGAELQLASGGPKAKFRILGWQRDYPNVPKKESSAVPSEPSPAERAESEEKHQLEPSTIPSNKGIQELNYQSQLEREQLSVLTTEKRETQQSEDKTQKKGSTWFRWKKLVVITGVLAAVLLATAVLFLEGQRRGSVADSETQNYLEQIQKGSELINSKGGYRVVIPRGWSKLASDSLISIESPDKRIAVDYVRDPRLSEESVVELLRAKGAVPSKVAESAPGGTPLVTYIGKGPSRIWLACLIEPKSDSPRLALMEFTTDVFKFISKDVLLELSLRQFQKLPGVTPVAPVVASTSDTPTSPTLAPVAMTPKAYPTSMPRGPSPLASADTQSKLSSVSAPEETLTSCSAVGLEVKLPHGWTARCDEENGIFYVYPSPGLEIRVTRDKSKLDAGAVFAEMEKDGWSALEKDSHGKTIEGHPGRIYGAYMQQASLYAFLGLVDQVDSSTLVIYGQQPKSFSEGDKELIQQVLMRLIASEQK